MNTPSFRQMEFPREVLELVISQGLDSCQTSISWMQISPIFQRLVISLLGVVVLQDGVEKLENIEIPFDYEMLMHKSNTLYVSTDHPDAEELLTFIKKYSHLIILIQTDRNYSDVLRSLWAGIVQECNLNTTICIVYSTLQNYFSKLYFREISRFTQRVRLSELHVVGNSAMHKNELFDIITLFERTYLYHLKKIYSLDVLSTSQKLISQELSMIKQLDFASFDEEWCHYFAECPNLRKIEDMKFPRRSNEEAFKLPKCESIALTHYAEGARYQPIDGSNISEELVLAPTLRSVDPEFHDLNFPDVKKLKLVLINSESQSVSFHDCHFPSLKSLDYGPCLTPWSDFQSSGAQLTQVSLALSTNEQLQWLLSCPYTLKKISIVSSKGRSPASSNLSAVIDPIKCSSLKIEVDSLWYCYLCHTLVFPNLGPHDDLTIILNLTSIMQSMLRSVSGIGKWELPLVDDCITFKFPYIRHLTLVVVDKEGKNVEYDGITESQFSVLESHPLSFYSNIFFDTTVPMQNYAVSPSAFRRNSLAGAGSEAARRQSTIPDLTRPRRHRSSSSSSTITAIPVVKTCTLLPSGNCPEIITTNIATLEASVLSWDEVKTNRIPLLRMLAEDCSVESDSLEDLIPPLSEQIISVLKYPYHTALQPMIVDNFQVVADLANLGLEIHETQQKQFKKDLQRYLAFKGHNLRVFTSLEQQPFRVSVLLIF